MPSSDCLRTSNPLSSLSSPQPPKDTSKETSKENQLIRDKPLEPPLLPQERSIVKSYGGWTNFLLSYGLKPWNDEYAEGGLMILKGLVECYSD